jgi:hypothetical protein
MVNNYMLFIYNLASNKGLKALFLMHKILIDFILKKDKLNRLKYA